MSNKMHLSENRRRHSFPQESKQNIMQSNLDHLEASISSRIWKNPHKSYHPNTRRFSSPDTQENHIHSSLLQKGNSPRKEPSFPEILHQVHENSLADPQFLKQLQSYPPLPKSSFGFLKIAKSLLYTAISSFAWLAFSLPLFFLWNIGSMLFLVITAVFAAICLIIGLSLLKVSSYYYKKEEEWLKKIDEIESNKLVGKPIDGKRSKEVTCLRIKILHQAAQDIKKNRTQRRNIIRNRQELGAPYVLKGFFEDSYSFSKESASRIQRTFTASFREKQGLEKKEPPSVPINQSNKDEANPNKK